ncbi:MAG: CBS domain-containing protein [Euryarchaeota archaeon]|nr:CBS domain-containing protein [Euryarchaeota archaeon]
MSPEPAPAPDILRVRDIMSRGVTTIDREATVLQAVKIMAERNIGSLVATEGGRPAGILTERDIVRKCLPRDAPSSTLKVKDFMSAPLVTIEPEADLGDVVRRMRVRNLRRLVVFDQGEMVGILTDRDVINAYPRVLFSETMKAMGGGSLPAPQVQGGNAAVEQAAKALLRKKIDEALDRAFVESVLQALEDPLQKKMVEIRKDLYQRYERALEDVMKVLLGPSP